MHRIPSSTFRWFHAIADLGIDPGMLMQEQRLVRLVNIVMLVIISFLVINIGISCVFYDEGGKRNLLYNVLHLILIVQSWTFNYFRKQWTFLYLILWVSWLVRKEI